MKVYHFKTNNTVKKNIDKVVLILNKYISYFNVWNHLLEKFELCNKRDILYLFM